MFADKYIGKNHLSELIQEPPHPDLGISVVIPCLNEPDLLQTLQSLWICKLPSISVEVILIINHSEAAPANIKAQNLNTRMEVESWIAENNKPGLRFFPVGPVELKKKWAGAGLARKRGMDEAVCRFNQVKNPGGVIVSLDADTLVDENYLIDIDRHFREHPSHVGATLAFQHQTAKLSEKHLRGILLYEQYMTYYKNALSYTGYPYPMFTVGSAFAVRADAYVRRGGMNRRQAGEDFYFLQNLVLLGPVGEIRSTTVHPSARLSTRVPFGTGPVLKKWMNGEEDLTKTYNFQAFADLKQLFDVKDLFYKILEKDYQKLISSLPASVGEFLKQDVFWQDIAVLNENCSQLSTFQNRFFQKFNAFKILKYLNFTHGTHYEKACIFEQINGLEANSKMNN